MIRRPPRSTLDRSSAASDVYKRQRGHVVEHQREAGGVVDGAHVREEARLRGLVVVRHHHHGGVGPEGPVSYTHLRAHETVLDLVCRLLLEKKKKTKKKKNKK